MTNSCNHVGKTTRNEELKIVYCTACGQLTMKHTQDDNGNVRWVPWIKKHEYVTLT